MARLSMPLRAALALAALALAAGELSVARPSALALLDGAGDDAAVTTEVHAAATTEGPKDDGDDDEAPETTEGPKEEKEEETTTPPHMKPTFSPVSILGQICSTILEELHNSRYQALNAFLAFAFGLAMVLDGESVFRWVVIGTVGIVVCIMAKNEATLTWGLEPDSVVGDVAGIEVGLLCGYAAYIGINGVMLLVGALFGTLVAAWASHLLISHGLAFLEGKAVLLVFFTVVVALFILMFKRKGHVTSLAVLAPLVGGALVTSATWFAMIHIALNKFPDWMAAHGLSPVEGHWISFLLLLLGSPEKVGLFVGSAHDVIFLGPRWPLDRIFGCLVWLALFAAGSYMQIRKDCEARLAQKSELGEPLLNA